MSAPDWVTTLPAVNAVLNGLATVLLVAGFLLIRRGRRQAHKTIMLTAFATSIVFLSCYLVYHFALKHYTGSSSKPFPGVGAIRSAYLVILATHVILAAAVPVLASMTIYRGLRADWVRHRRIARVTFPIWVYVSVTGVIIYFMVYHWPADGDRRTGLQPVRNPRNGLQTCVPAHAGNSDSSARDSSIATAAGEDYHTTIQNVLC